MNAKLTTAMLYLDNVSVASDGFKAINGLSLTLEPGEMRAIIGPNGAGKTTMMDIITGKTKPDEGYVFFDGETDLTAHDESAIASMGIGRKFQKPTVFESHTVFENLEIAQAGEKTVLSTLFARLSPRELEQIEAVLETVGLEDVANKQAGSLSHGQKQWLEIGMLLMQNPLLLLVDEPAAGMTHQEIDRTVELLTSLAGDHSLVVVEHDMDFVRALNARVTVLHQGRVLAEGNMDKIQDDERGVEHQHVQHASLRCL